MITCPECAMEMECMSDLVARHDLKVCGAQIKRQRNAALARVKELEAELAKVQQPAPDLANREAVRQMVEKACLTMLNRCGCGWSMQNQIAEARAYAARIVGELPPKAAIDQEKKGDGK